MNAIPWPNYSLYKTAPFWKDLAKDTKFDIIGMGEQDRKAYWAREGARKKIRDEKEKENRAKNPSLKKMGQQIATVAGVVAQIK